MASVEDRKVIVFR